MTSWPSILAWQSDKKTDFYYYLFKLHETILTHSCYSLWQFISTLQLNKKYVIMLNGPCTILHLSQTCWFFSKVIHRLDGLRKNFFVYFNENYFFSGLRRAEVQYNSFTSWSWHFSSFLVISFFVFSLNQT